MLPAGPAPTTATSQEKESGVRRQEIEESIVGKNIESRIQNPEYNPKDRTVDQRRFAPATCGLRFNFLDSRNLEF